MTTEGDKMTEEQSTQGQELVNAMVDAWGRYTSLVLAGRGGALEPCPTELAKAVTECMLAMHALLKYTNAAAATKAKEEAP
jgi:hypothetical protein